MKKILTLLLFLVSSIASINATDFYSKIAAVDPNAAASWNTMVDGSGTDAVAGDFTATGNKFIVQTGTTMVTTAAWAFGGATSTLQISNGATLQASHAITVSAGTTLQIDNGGIYIHNHAATASANIFAGIESFGVSSTVTINNWTGTGTLATGVTSSAVLGGNSYLFGNLIVNWAGAAASTWSQGISTTTYYAAGDMTFQALGSAAAAKFRFISSGAPTVHIGGTLTVGAILGTVEISNSTSASILNVGAYTQTGGLFNLAFSSGATTMNCAGTFTQNGGTFDLSASGIGTVVANGDFTQTTGTLTETGSSTTSAVRFGAGVTQFVTLSGTTSNTVNFAIINTNGIDLTGTMTVNAGATLTIATTAPAPVSGAGTVSYTGTISSLATLSTLRYMNADGTTFTGGAQTITDKVWPTTNGPNALSINNSTASPNNTVTSALTADRTLLGGASSLTQLTITNGVFDIASSSIALGLNATYSISTPNNTKMIATSGTGYFKMYMAAGAFTSLTFPIGDLETSADYAEVYFTYSTAASAASFVGVQVKNTIISGDVPGADYAPRHWSFKQETVVANAPSGVAFVSAPAYTHKVDGKGPTAEVVGMGSNIRLFKNVAGVYTQLSSGFSAGYTVGNFNPGSFPAQSETSVDGYKYAPRTYLGQQTYIWNGATTDYQVATNWTPTRASLDQADILTFNGTPATATVTNIPTETIGKLVFSGNVQATLTATGTLNTGGGTATGIVDVLNIGAGSKLTMNGALNLAGPATATTRTATVDGTLEIATGTTTIAGTNSPKLTFGATGVLTIPSTATGGLTNSGFPQANFLEFANGAVYNHLRSGGTVQMGANYIAGSTINVGTSAARLTSAPSMALPATLAANFNYYANNSSTFQSISVAAATSISGNVTLDNTNVAGLVILSGVTSTNTLTFTGEVNISATVRMTTNSASASAPVYNFSRTTAPSLNVGTNGSINQTPTTSTTAAHTTVNIAKGMTFANGTALRANTNASATSGDFRFNINNGDVTFGATTTMAGAPNTASSTAKIDMQFLNTTTDQNYTPASTFSGRNNLQMTKSGFLLNLLGNLTANTITLSSGKLVIGNNNVTVTPFGTNASSGLLTGSLAGGWIAQTGTGTVTMTNVTSTGKNFPVGVTTTSYDPVFITPVTTVSFTVLVKSAITNAVSNPTKVVSREWDITRTGTASVTDLDFTAHSSALTVDNTPSGAVGVIGHWNGASWDADISSTYSSGTWSVVDYAGAFSPFVVGAPGSVLAVEFESITAAAKGSLNIINFTTATEKDVKEFAIERSINNRTWEVMGTKAAIGGTSAANYSFNDVNPTALSYYRVRSIETSGKDQLSKVVAVKRNGGKLAVNMVSPVPTTEGVTVDFSTSKVGTLNVVIMDIVGKVVKTETFKTVEGANMMRLNLSNLAQGTYILTLNDGETMATQRIVKQ